MTRHLATLSNSAPACVLLLHTHTRPLQLCLVGTSLETHAFQSHGLACTLSRVSLTHTHTRRDSYPAHTLPGSTWVLVMPRSFTDSTRDCPCCTGNIKRVSPFQVVLPLVSHNDLVCCRVTPPQTKLTRSTSRHKIFWKARKNYKFPFAPPSKNPPLSPPLKVESHSYSRRLPALG